MHFLDARGPDGMRLYAIGDVHGRLDLLTLMHDRIAGEIARDARTDWRIIHLGDYVDRGPDSRGVVDFLVARMRDEPRIHALMGNHDAGMLDFLARPDTSGLFARFGGAETAESYGVGIDFSSDAMAAAGARLLEAVVPAAHLEFLRGLPRALTYGDFFFCHAGIRPGVPLDRQNPEDLVWIRREFLDWPHPHEKVVVHGHTPHSHAQIFPNRINVDTLAYASGRLTALVVDGAEKRLVEATI